MEDWILHADSFQSQQNYKRGGEKMQGTLTKGWMEGCSLFFFSVQIMLTERLFNFFIFFIIIFFLTLQRDDLTLQLIFNANIAIWYHSN